MPDATSGGAGLRLAIVSQPRRCLVKHVIFSLSLSAICAASAACSAQGAASTSAPESAGGMTASSHAMMSLSQAKTDQDMMKRAMSAAPDAVSKDATLVAMDDKMQMRTLRAGTNGWTCLPDMPQTPGTDPMCMDKNGMEWAAAWMSHKDPPKEKMALGYMLMGGSDASNSDPFATTPKAGDRWVDTGPHVMVMNIGDRFAGYPTQAENTKVPYVMYPNTPFAHLMIPVK